MNIINVVQGSAEWHALRAKHFTASEAPAMLGISKYKTRSDLLREKATGIASDVDEATQKRFDDGHAAEAAARPLVEALLVTELYPATATLDVDGLPLLASFDGISMDEVILWENKLANGDNADLQAAIDRYHWPQLEQQMLIAGNERIFFTVSDGTEEGTHGIWYDSRPDRRAALISGWKQFAADLSQYQHIPEAPASVPAAIEALPALLVQVEGRVLATNLDAFKDKVIGFVKNIKTNLTTDQDFADADNMTKFLKDGEERLDAVKSQALAQTSSIDELFRTIDYLREEMRSKRLTLERAVKSQKDAIRQNILQGARDALAAHIAGLNTSIGKPYMPTIAADFASVMKGKKTVSSLRNAVDTELARAKIEANEEFELIQTNMRTLREMAADHVFLFADTAQIVLKANDDLVALIKTRIADHKAAEEERSRLEKARQEAEAASTPEPASVPSPATQVQVSAPAAIPHPPKAAGLVSVSASIQARPGDDEIIAVLATHFRVHDGIVIGWLADMDLAQASKRMVGEFSRQSA